MENICRYCKWYCSGVCENSDINKMMYGESVEFAIIKYVEDGHLREVLDESPVDIDNVTKELIDKTVYNMAERVSDGKVYFEPDDNFGCQFWE